MVEKENDNFKMVDLMKYSSGFNLGYRYAKYSQNERMKQVISNISKFNKGDPFTDGMLQGFENSRSQNPAKNKRKNELDGIFNEKNIDRNKKKGLDR